MGTYYRIDNHDKKESIDPYDLANIKYGCIAGWSLQHAILGVFLGFDYNRSCNLGKNWVGRWELDRIRVHSDSENDSECDKWKDVSRDFLGDLFTAGILGRWMNDAGFDPAYTKHCIERMPEILGKVNQSE